MEGAPQQDFHQLAQPLDGAPSASGRLQKPSRRPIPMAEAYEESQDASDCQPEQISPGVNVSTLAETGDLLDRLQEIPPASTESGQPNVIMTPYPDMGALSRAVIDTWRKRGYRPPRV
jgi:hypothetical protein